MLEHEHLKNRRAMVATQLRDRDIRDERLLTCMESVPRHCFVPHDLINQAYEDHPIPIGGGQTISQPYMVACMTALLELRASDHVLEIGTGSGYQTAVLAQLCHDVVSIECNAQLSARAQACLGQLRVDNATLHCGDGTLGWVNDAPYDAILVTAGGPRIPDALLRQLAEGGCLVCPVGSREKQRLLRIVKQGEDFVTTSHTNCIFVPLVGEDGWESARP